MTGAYVELAKLNAEIALVEQQALSLTHTQRPILPTCHTPILPRRVHVYHPEIFFCGVQRKTAAAIEQAVDDVKTAPKKAVEGVSNTVTTGISEAQAKARAEVEAAKARINRN